MSYVTSFFFQAEDGIRDVAVTGVQTCALPIYSGIILKAIGIPTSMFTVIFALARTVGWISHWKEMLSSPYKIGRPRQLYTGYESRDITKLEDRK